MAHIDVRRDRIDAVGALRRAGREAILDHVQHHRGGVAGVRQRQDLYGGPACQQAEGAIGYSDRIAAEQADHAQLERDRVHGLHREVVVDMEGPGVGIATLDQVFRVETMPARADILTGTFSYTHMGWEPLPRRLTTLPEVMSAAGYTTMGVVDTPFYIRNGFGYDRGFDDFIWVRGQGDDTRPHERSDYRETWRSESDRLVARTVTEAERWLERHHEEREHRRGDRPHERRPAEHVPRQLVAGQRGAVDGVPPALAADHPRRAEQSLPDAERDRLSKRNFYRFLDRWGDRPDLLLHGDGR